MQDRRQVSFILALVGSIFSLGTGFMMLVMSMFVFGAVGFPMPGASFFVGLMGWLSVASLVGGLVTLVGAMKLRQATGQALRGAGVWCIVGGAVCALGGNFLAAAAGIVGGTLVLGEPPSPVPA